MLLSIVHKRMQKRKPNVNNQSKTCSTITTQKQQMVPTCCDAVDNRNTPHIMIVVEGIQRETETAVSRLGLRLRDQDALCIVYGAI